MSLRAYKHYMLGILTLLLLFNWLDRIALGLMLQDIKTDLQLSDTQLGFLTGIAFALFYSVMGIPIARWADRGNRVLIIALSAIVWSISVALCGIATGFIQLLLIRIMVAVGEAGGVPPAYSLMADYFTRAERPRATSIYALGGGLSAITAYVAGGWLIELYGWRVTFVVLGAPGVLLGVLAWITLREPRLSEGLKIQSIAQPRLTDVCKRLWANTTFRHLMLCLSVLYFFGYGIMQWMPTFFVRSFDMTIRELGMWLALSSGVGGLVGAYVGGELAVRRAANDERSQLRAMATAIAVAGLVSTLVYVSPSPYLALALIGVSTVGTYTINGPLVATMQTVVPEQMRAMAFALTFFMANLIGMGLGPLAAGALSDAFRPWAGEESLRYALMFLGPGYFWCAWHAWRASQTVARDLAPVSAELAQESQEHAPSAAQA